MTTGDQPAEPCGCGLWVCPECRPEQHVSGGSGGVPVTDAGRTGVRKDGTEPTPCGPNDPGPRDRAGCGGVGCPCSDTCEAAR